MQELEHERVVRRFDRSRRRPIESLPSSAQCDRQKASALVAVLVCLTLLSLVVYGLLGAAIADQRVSKNHSDIIQARYLAIAGIEKAKALIYHEYKREGGRTKESSTRLCDDPGRFSDAALGRGRFRLYHIDPETGLVVYGLEDEESRLNVNTVTLDDLKRLVGLPEAIAAAMVDFRDEDSDVSPGGAEADHYASLRPPYRIQNAPFQTIASLLAVRGVTPELLFGDSGLVTRLPGSDEGPVVVRGSLAWHLTALSGARNVNAKGRPRIDLSIATAAELARIPGLSNEVAAAILAHRDQNRLESLADLLRVSGGRRGGPEPSTFESVRSGDVPSPNPGGEDSGRNGNAGPSVITRETLKSIADEVTVSRETTIPGAVNLNTASVTVLRCLPGVTEELATAIASYRQSRGHFETVAHLLDVPGMTDEIFRQLVDRTTVRGDTFRVISEGVLPATGATRRIEAVLRYDGFEVELLAYREDGGS
jgi:competence ComEA-like helix-hairpin-helix protein